MGVMEEYQAALGMRDIISKMVRQEIAYERPRPRYATVESVNHPAREATVRYAGDPDPIVVSLGAVRPRGGSIVRIEGPQGDRYVSDVMGRAWYGNDKVYFNVATDDSKANIGADGVEIAQFRPDYGVFSTQGRFSVGTGGKAYFTGSSDGDVAYIYSNNVFRASFSSLGLYSPPGFLGDISPGPSNPPYGFYSGGSNVGGMFWFGTPGSGARGLRFAVEGGNHFEVFLLSGNKYFGVENISANFAVGGLPATSSSSTMRFTSIGGISTMERPSSSIAVKSQVRMYLDDEDSADPYDVLTLKVKTWVDKSADQDPDKETKYKDFLKHRFTGLVVEDLVAGLKKNPKLDSLIEWAYDDPADRSTWKPIEPNWQAITASLLCIVRDLVGRSDAHEVTIKALEEKFKNLDPKTTK